MSETEDEIDDPRTEASPLRNALCLSGGGYRAMLFHVGTVLRMREAGILKDLNLISSVSGGSITSAVLALAWKHLDNDAKFTEHFVDRIKKLASVTIDRKSVLTGLLPGPSISGLVEKAYRKHLFDDRTLQDLPNEPRFVINATNLQSGALWRFSKPYARDWRVGKISNPTITLAKAVAASSAFPPILSPCKLDLAPADFDPDTGHDLQEEPYTSGAILADGGVYDNLGLEAAWKRSTTIFVSDAGGKMSEKEKPPRFWPTQLFRVYMVTDNQVRSLRKRWFIERAKSGAIKGAFWGIRTSISEYSANDKLHCPTDKTMELASTPTRLAALDPNYQERLINWGYASTDASIRSYFDTNLPIGTFPYPSAKV